MTSPGESKLVAALKAGEPGAFEQLVRLHGGRMLMVARRLLRSEEDASDAVQDAFLSAFRAMSGFAEGCQLSTWLHRITVNSALMKLRSRRHKPEESIEDLLPSFREDGHRADPGPAWSGSIELLLESRETRQLVRECIDRLPESYRTVLLLRDIEDLDTEETAEALGLTTTAVKVRLHRARQALRELLDPHLRHERP